MSRPPSDVEAEGPSSVPLGGHQTRDNLRKTLHASSDKVSDSMAGDPQNTGQKNDDRRTEALVDWRGAGG